MKGLRHFLIIAALWSTSRAQDPWLGGLSSGTRIRSMGTCFAAASGPGDALLFNPAGLASRRGSQGLDLELNPILPFTFQARQEEGDWHWARALPALSLVRRVGWKSRRLSVALGSSEWQPDSVESLPGLQQEARPSSADIVPALTLALALDDRVRLGGTLSACFDREQHRRRVGVAYGAIIRANRRMDVGANAVYFPEGAAQARRTLDRLGDGTINVGVAWHPLGRPEDRRARSTLMVAMDVRNVTQDAGLAGSQEFHLGAEALWHGRLALRGGLQWPNQHPSASRPRFSGGLALREILPWGTLQADLGLMETPLGNGRVWMAGLGWSP